MSASGRSIPRVAIILVLGVCVIIALLNLRPEPKRAAPPPPKPLPVSVFMPSTESVVLKVKAQGTVAPRREIFLVAQVAGQIVDTSDDFVNGGFFEVGDVLVAIDDRNYQVAVVQALADVATAEEALASERGLARQAKREWRDLGNSDANELFLRKPQLAATEARLASAKANLTKAELDLERTQVVAPFAGVIRQTQVDLGQYLTSGSQVAQIFDTAIAQVRLPLSDRQAAMINLPLGQSRRDDALLPNVVLTGTVAGETHHWLGKIVRTEASLDINTRFYYAVVEVEQPYVFGHERQRSHQSVRVVGSRAGGPVDVAPMARDVGDTEGGQQKLYQAPMVIGLFVEAEIEGRQVEDVLVLPVSAVFKRDQVYVVDSENRLALLTVEVIYRDENQVWVRNDFGLDAPIVRGQQSLLSPGLLVAIDDKVAGGVLTPEGP